MAKFQIFEFDDDQVLAVLRASSQPRVWSSLAAEVLNIPINEVTISMVRGVKDSCNQLINLGLVCENPRWRFSAVEQRDEENRASSKCITTIDLGTVEGLDEYEFVIDGKSVITLSFNPRNFSLHISGGVPSASISNNESSFFLRTRDRTS